MGFVEWFHASQIEPESVAMLALFGQHTLFTGERPWNFSRHRGVTSCFQTLPGLCPGAAGLVRLSDRLAWWSRGFPTALLHLLYMAALVLCLVELQLRGYRKIPLTCPVPGIRDHLTMLCVAQSLGFMLFTGAGAGLERWMLAAPLRFLLVPVTMLGAWHWNRRRYRDALEAGEVEEGLTFDNIHTPAVERWNL